MRSLLVVASLSLLTACTTVAGPGTPMPSALPTSSDITGRWTGTWIGTGLFESPREDEVILDIRQVGRSGYGRMVFDGSTAAESVPWDMRREGLAGARVSASISGSRVYVKHERGSRYFAAELTRVSEDRMIGDVRGAAPGVQLVLTRSRRAEAPQSARVLPAPRTLMSGQQEPQPAPAPIVALKPIEEPTTEPAPEKDPVQIASVIPSEEPQAPEASGRPRIEEFMPAIDLKNVYFDFDSSKLRADAQDSVATNATWLKEHGDLEVLIEGHCDEVGTPEYNQVLGERRAESVKASLAASGIEPDRLATISYGKERPVCTENTEECRKLNRHVEFRIKSR